MMTLRTPLIKSDRTDEDQRNRSAERSVSAVPKELATRAYDLTIMDVDNELGSAIANRENNMIGPISNALYSVSSSTQAIAATGPMGRTENVLQAIAFIIVLILAALFLGAVMAVMACLAYLIVPVCVVAAVITYTSGMFIVCYWSVGIGVVSLMAYLFMEWGIDLSALWPSSPRLGIRKQIIMRPRGRRRGSR